MNDDTRNDSFIENYLAFLLAKTSHLVSTQFHAKLKALGVSISSWRILASLRDHDRNVGELADMVLLNQPTLSKILDRLQAKELVRRNRDNNNRRNVVISLTPAGQQMVEQLIPLANEHEARVFAHLSAKQRGDLVAMLRSTLEHNGDDNQK